MGRPLNKKFFGGRNVGTGGYEINGSLSNSQNYADDRIGGEGIASLNITLGGNYINRLPTVTIPAPSIPGGVQSTFGPLHSVAVNASPYAKGSGYQIGDILTDRNGSTWRVTKLRVLTATLGSLPSSQNFDGGEWLVFDSYVDSHWTTITQLKGCTSTGNPNYDLSGYNAGASVYGVWDGTDGTPAPTGAITITGTTGGTIGITRGNGNPNGPTQPGLDGNGSGGTVTFTYGVEEVALVSSIDYVYGTSYYYAGNNTTTVAPTGGTGAQLNVGFAADHIAMTEKGSGYIGSEALTFTSTSGGGEVTATGTIVLTTDSGDRPGYGDNNANTNQENAILIYANPVGEGAALGDIIKQSNARSYKVRTTDGIGICKLVDSDSPAEGEAYIVATATGGTYYVTKLTAHRATLVAKTGDEALDGKSVQWTFGSPTDTIVQIANA
jgi:hypothetical protein